jgi:hypothetical protein
MTSPTTEREPQTGDRVVWVNKLMMGPITAVRNNTVACDMLPIDQKEAAARRRPIPMSTHKRWLVWNDEANGWILGAPKEVRGRPKVITPEVAIAKMQTNKPAVQ